MNDNFENKNYQNFNRAGAQNNAQNTNGNPQNQKVKLRLRLKSGEEFEAEGDLPFVLEQKNEFLAQTGNIRAKRPQQVSQPVIVPEITENSNTTPFTEEITPSQTAPETHLNYATASRVTADEYRLRIPAIQRRQMESNSKQNPTAAEAPNSVWQIDEKIWSKIAYLDGTDIVLRRKIKDLKPGIAALITLAAAKMLAGIMKMSALELSKSLKMSGYLKPTDRLDRILAAEIKAGTLFFEGSKRNREYMISQTGTAKAYTSAEHFLL